LIDLTFVLYVSINKEVFYGGSFRVKLGKKKDAQELVKGEVWGHTSLVIALLLSGRCNEFLSI